jgi:hypothetical protein
VKSSSSIEHYVNDAGLEIDLGKMRIKETLKISYLSERQDEAKKANGAIANQKTLGCVVDGFKDSEQYRSVTMKKNRNTDQ